ncbi:SUR7 protein [Phlyctema vagabunda]|uniref:SUR7 protein n=1 Tax=Phlyctema vagabunda TaxID=108571 RepID=A0ABR4PYK5_9HELO
MRFSALLPLLFAIAAFILSMLCLFAGHKEGFMEDYDIIRLNTSRLGYAQAEATATSSAGAAATSFSSSLGAWIDGIEDDITDSIDGAIDDAQDAIADKLAEELGIEEWYSLHLMDMCQGMFRPNATAKNSKLNVTDCSNRTAMYHFDIESVLNEQLSLGPLDVSLSDLGWSDDIQDGINALNTAMSATFVLYAIGIAAAGVSVITALLAFFMHGSRLISIGNWGLAFISFLSLLVSSVIVTVFQNKAASVIRRYGNDIGIFADKGTKFLILTWVATACMFIASIAWIFEFCAGRSKRNRDYTEKGTPVARRSRFGRFGRRSRI